MKQVKFVQLFVITLLVGVLLGNLTNWDKRGIAQAAALSAPDSPNGASTLGDYVWHDLNANGLQEPSEPGIDGVIVNLYRDDGDGLFEPNSGDTLLSSMPTGDNPATANVVEHGWYDFDVDFGPNIFHWVQIDPSNFAPTKPLNGYVLTSAGVTSFNSPAYVIEPAVTADRNDVDFGYAKIGLQVQKTVYLGQNGGASCPGGELATGVNGAQVTYCFVVTNTGQDAYLSSITLNDPSIGVSVGQMTLKSGSFPLAPGASATYYYQTTITKDLTNVVTASGTPVDAGGTPLPEAPKPSITDTAQIDQVTPAIDLQKTIYLGQNSGASCPGGVETAVGVNGAQVTYCFVVKNTGDTYLNAVTVDDPSLGINVGQMTLKSGTLPLAPNATLVYYYQTTITKDLTNTATASGTPTDSNGNPLPGVPKPTKTDTANVDQVAPAIDLQKTVYLGQNNGAACPGSELVTGINGTQVTYCFKVTNTGDTPLGQITINDSVLGISANNMTLKSGTTPLAPGASLLYYYQTTISKDLTNSATTTGTPVDNNGNPLPGLSKPTKTDTAAVDLVAPALDLQKTVYFGQNNGASCPGSESVIGPNGGQITYCFKVINTGDTALASITLDDPSLGINVSNLTLQSGTLPLAPGASLLYYYQTTITKDLINTASTSGTPVDGNGTPLPGVPKPTKTDTANVDQIAPAIDLQKTIYLNQDGGLSCPGGETVIGVVGKPITYCFRVTNTGDTYLTNVTVNDPSLAINQSNMTLKSGVLPLAPGASLVYFYQTTIAQDLTNTATTTGTPSDSNGNPLPNVPNPSKTDTARVDQVTAQIDLQKTIYVGHDNGNSCPGVPSLTAANGSQVTYCFKVTNSGDTYLASITLDDPALAINISNLTLKSGTIPLAPGASLVYYYQTTLKGDLTNTATTSGNPVDQNGNDLPGIDNPTKQSTAVVDATGPGIKLQKTVYLGQNSGASCPGGEQVQGNKGTTITYCFLITNTGDTYLSDITLTDALLNLDLSKLTLKSGTLPLAQGASLLYYYQSTISAAILNTATTSGNPVDVNGNDIPGLAQPSDLDTAQVVLKGGSISGTVWADKNDNGVVDQGEVGIPGVTVTLSNGSKTTTDQQGYYLFDNLPDGTYAVVETDLPGYISTADKDGGNPNLISNLVINNGNDITGQDFLDGPQFGTIIGVVFNDLNGSLLQDQNEPGLPSVTVKLSDGRTTTTDASGHYTFTNVIPGAYTVTETDPPGFSSTTNNIVPVFVPPAGVGIANFGDKQIGSISGVVFNDFNGDGIKSPGDNGLSGVVIQLLDSNGNVIKTTTTATDGSYSFPDVQPGSYTVREIDPPNFTSTTNNNVPVSVPPGGAATANFGDQQVGTISGVVFNDKNGNGLKSPDEPGIPSVVVQLVDSNGTVIATTSTGPDGSYLFTNVQPGSYTVRETDLPGYTSTTTNNVPVSVLPGGGAIANFGDQQVGTISGVVFNDTNGNGIKEPGENPLSGVLIQLYDTKNQLIATTITGPDGAYNFTNVTPNPYIVREIDPQDYTSTTNNTVPVSVPPGGAATANFGDQQVGTISGVVFNDVDGDGNQDNGDHGIGGVTVDLIDTQGKVISTTVTAGDGSYKFPNVTPGAYVVQETDPTGFTSTTNNKVPVNVPPGGIGIANFGDQQRSSISGVVFNDTNGDGSKSNTENGIGGVLVELRDVNGTLITSTVTAGDGSYLFNNVTPGNYIVRETDPKGFTSTTPNNVSVAVPAGGSATANFGDRQVGSISGVVFNDTNGDGKQDPGENGIGGVVVELYDSGGTRVITTTTTGNGAYDFTNLQPGNYVVKEIDPPGYASTTNNIVPVNVPNGGSATANFGDRQVGTISGVVFNDANKNKIQDANEPGIGGVAVQLVDSNGKVVAVTITSSDGSYVFTNVPPGNYQLQEFNLNGTGNTTPDIIHLTVEQNGNVTPTDNPDSNFGDTVDNPKAIALDRFFVLPQDNALALHWQTTIEIDTVGYHIVRSPDNNRNHAVQVTKSMITAKGPNGGDYSFVDNTVQPNVPYTYWLGEVTADGNTIYYGPVRGGLFSHSTFLPVIKSKR